MLRSPQPSRRGHRLARRTLTLVAVAALAAVAVPTAASSAPDPNGAVVTSGDDWLVTRAAGGYYVTLLLDEPLPIRSAIPVLYADGELIGAATEGTDGLSLSLTTTDDAVATAATITWGFDGDAEDSEGNLVGPTTPTLDALVTDPAAVEEASEADLTAAALDAAPAVPEAVPSSGYSVATLDYDFGTQAVDLRDIGGVKGEFRGRVYLPVGKTGTSPLIIFLHGRHTSCSGTPSNPLRYPCTATQVEIPSYLGYEGPATALAKLGYTVVSISANAINSNDNQLAPDYGATARGQLVIDHLDYLAEANAGSVEQLGTALTGKLDFSNVGLMGHSRGGDGVVRAALINQSLDEPYNITSVLPLAPVDFGRLTLPEVPLMTILPYCDGDVTNLQGQHFIDDSRHAFGDDVLRSAVLTLGTNHNFYNTVWTPGKYAYSTSDDWGSATSSNGRNPVCGTAESVAETTTRLSADDQYYLGTTLITAWFRLTMGGEDAYLPMFDGSGAIPASVQAFGGQYITTASQPASDTTDIQTFEEATTSVRASASSVATFCASMANAPAPYQKPVCASTLTSAQAPHWAQMRFAPSAPATPMLKYTWTAATASLKVDVPASAADVSGREALSFRMAPNEGSTTTQDIKVTLIDKTGAKATVTVSTYSSAVNPLPFVVVPEGETAPGGTTNLNKVILRQVRIPATAFTGVDLTKLARIDFTPVAASGGVYLSDLAFVDSGVGAASLPTTLPSLTMGSTYVNEGNAPGTALLPIRLNRATDLPVTGYFEAIGSTTTGAAVANQSVPFTIKPGKTCVAVAVPLDGNRLKASTATTDYKVTASVVANATTAEAFGVLKVREDDAVVLDDGTVLPMADPIEDPGDPCGEQPADYDSRVIAYVSPSTVTVGATAKISATVVVLASGAPAPTGMVTFKDAGNVIGAVAVAANGSATLDVSDLPAGTHTIAVEYSGNAEVAASATSVTLVVGAAGPLALGTVTASTMGQAAPGVTVTVTAPATPADAILSYVWYRGSSVISAATGATYQLTASDAGRDLVVKVTAAKNGDSVTKYSNHVEVLGLTALTIAGTASPGNTLTATATYLPATATVAYQWYRGSSAISGAQSATYTLQAADAGADISAKAIVSAGGVTSAAKYSNHLQVLGASAAYLTGLAEVGSTLTLNVTLEATDATVTYNWYRGTAMIKGATGTTYEVTAADAGQDLVAKVSVTKEGVDSPAVKYSNHVVVNQ